MLVHDVYYDREAGTHLPSLRGIPHLYPHLRDPAAQFLDLRERRVAVPLVEIEVDCFDLAALCDVGPAFRFAELRQNCKMLKLHHVIGLADTTLIFSMSRELSEFTR